MIELPQSLQWIQTNHSDVLGNMQGSFNLDLTKILGKTRVTRMIQSTLQSVDTNLTSYAIGFKIYSTFMWAVAGLRVHLASSIIPNSNFAVDTTSNTPSDCDSTLSDIEVFGGSLYVTGNSKLYQFNGSSWSNTSFSGAGPWMMTSYAARLYFTAGLQKIYSTPDGSTIATSGINSITLDQNYVPTCLRSANDRIWICTLARTGKGYIYEWDGVTSQPTFGYRLESGGALACVIWNDVPWVIDTNGRLLKFSNSTFVEVARLPLNDRLLNGTMNLVNNRFIHPNGMTVVNGKVQILINNIMDDGTINEFCPSGIWEYDNNLVNLATGESSGVGLYHKYSLSYLPTNTNTITDYGQNRVSGVGALSEMKVPLTAANSTGNLLAGATVYLDASNTASGIFTNDIFEATSGTAGQYNTQGFGYIVTTKQFAIDAKGNPAIQNTWQNIYALYKKLLLSTSKIVVKYRTIVSSTSEISITWVTTSTFTTLIDVRLFVGYELEGIQGTGSCFCSHITKVDVTSGVYTVTVDETYMGATGTAKVRIQQWKKISEITQTMTTYDQAGLGDQSNWIQFKICMLFSANDELEKLLVTNNDTYPAAD